MGLQLLQQTLFIVGQLGGQVVKQVSDARPLRCPLRQLGRGNRSLVTIITTTLSVFLVGRQPGVQSLGERDQSLFACWSGWLE